VQLDQKEGLLPGPSSTGLGQEASLAYGRYVLVVPGEPRIAVIFIMIISL
jgi:hypothetical protein